MNEPTLSDQLRDQRFQHRLEQASLIAKHDDSFERSAAALSAIKNLALQQLADKFTKEQLTALYDRFESLVDVGDRERLPPVFGFEAAERITGPWNANFESK